MPDFNEMLQGILSNPQALEQIKTLAQGLGLSDTTNMSAPAPPAPPPPAPVQPDFNQLLQGFVQLSRSTPINAQQMALLQALKPFMRPDRAARLDKAIQVARLSQLAGNAFQQMGPQLFGGGNGHV